jgi:uncharacterized peroxidase-related enzyme
VVASDLQIDDAAAQELVDRIAVDWRSAGLDAATAALLEFTELLTASPAGMGRADIDALREAGWGDRAIHDATQVCSFFNYINRIADALGVHPESWIDLDGRPLG